ncbi:glycoside hydrolase superfamily [Aspergillus spectabilis]
MAVAAERTTLRTSWSFKRTDQDDDAWALVAQVPTVIHMHLLDNKKFPDPFIGTNELDVEWIGEHSWTYQTTFNLPGVPQGARSYTSKQRIHSQTYPFSNMFQPQSRYYGCAALVWINSSGNRLRQRLAARQGIGKKHPEHRFIAHNGEAGRLGVRKAQYHWGWDWGPVLMTAGPFRPVHLEVSSANIGFAEVDYELSNDRKSVAGTVSVDVGGDADEVVLSLRYEGAVVYTGRAPVAADISTILNFQLDHPKLWYPSGYGEQPLYEVVAQVVKGGNTLDTWQRRTGFRQSDLIQKDRFGESFYFRGNGVNVFAKIMTRGKQHRVWGGGIYEDDAFYDICDELGILVWQDFMLACGSYPTWSSLRDSVLEEAKQNVRRLRHNPSVVFWAGNNEDYQIQEEYKLDYDYENNDPEPWLKGSSPARYYYENLLPTVDKQEAPAEAYWPSSPFSGGKNSCDLTVGDVINGMVSAVRGLPPELTRLLVWHGSQEKYRFLGSEHN